MDVLRYARNISFAPIGKKGQKRLLESTVAVLGLGAIGTIAASYLARSGVNLILIDRDTIDKTNLQRQLLYTDSDALSSLPKAKAAKKALSLVNPDISITAHPEDLSSQNASHLLSSADFIIDATDNLETRFLLNDFCVKEAIPWAYSAAIGDKGASATLVPGSACLACFLPSPSAGVLPTCESEGILAPAAGISGSIAASEAIKYLSEVGRPNSCLLSFSLLHLSFSLSRIKKRPSCRVCSKHDFIFLKRAAPAFPACSGSFQFFFGKALDLSLISSRLEASPETRILLCSKSILSVEHSGAKLSFFPSGKAIVRNCRSRRKAKSLVAKLLGI